MSLILKYLEDKKISDTDEYELRIGAMNRQRYDPNLHHDTFDKVINMLAYHGTKKMEVITIHEYKYSESNYNYVHREIYNDYNNNNEPKKLLEVQTYRKKRIKNITVDIDLRLSYSTEEKITQKDFDLTKATKTNKRRFKKLFSKNIRMEATVIDNGPRTVPTYQVEFEILKNKTKEIKDVISFIREKIYGKIYLTESIKPMNPHTLEQKNLNKLMTNEYSVTDKADGERYFLKIIPSIKVHVLVNPKTKKEIDLVYTDTSIKDTTIIDGEYIEHNKTFYAFDMIYSDGKDFRNKYLDVRLKELKKYSTKLKALKSIDFNVKKFYLKNIYKKSKELWENRKKLFTYELDGLIFTPIQQVYTGMTENQILPVYKWKESQSIDVRVEYSRKDNFTYFHHSSYNQKSKDWDIRGLQHTNEIKFARWSSKKDYGSMGKMSNGYFFLGLEGEPRHRIKTRDDIVEYEWDGKKWKFLRLRTDDKVTPNKYKTIENSLNFILYPITIDNLIDMDNNSEQIGNIYDITSDTIKRDNWRKFHNYIKGELISKNAGSMTLDLGCGKGGDVFKLKKAGVKTLLAIDSSYVELYGQNGYEERLLTNGFTKKDFYYTNGTMTVCIVWGDISKSITRGTAGMNPDEKEKLKKFFKKFNPDKTFDSVQIMYAIHYLFGKTTDNKNWKSDTKTIEKFSKNIIRMLRDSGIFYGVYLKGEKIKHDMVFMKENKAFYQITHVAPKNKKYIESLLIENEVWGEGVVISEPKLYKKTLNDTFGELKDESGTMKIKDMITKFMSKKKLLEDEEKLGLINDVFIFKK